MLTLSRLFPRLVALLGSPLLALAAPQVPVGLAKIEITPDVPIRLSGYGSRQAESTTIATPLHARAIAIGSDETQPVVLIAVETIGIPAELADSVAAALKRSHGLDRSRIAVSGTHIHTGPAVAGPLTDFLFERDLPREETERIEQYTRTLAAKLERVATEALADRQPARLAWGQGSVDFATYRRKISGGKWVGWGADRRGPADHSLPVLRVTDPAGRVRGILLNYACHCTTLLPKQNFVHSDWAGDAATKLEAGHPGAVALVTIGCGADANPQPRGKVEDVSLHGSAIAEEVERVLGTKLQPLGAVSSATLRQVPLSLAKRVTREEFVERQTTGSTAAKFTASKWIQHIDDGKPVPASVACPVQVWAFDADLALILLGGEVVSEYALRLKEEFDDTRIWVTAYTNSQFGYVPSWRMFAEGGYEVDQSTHLYGLPAPFSPEVEDQLINAIHEVVPEDFYRQRP